MIVRSGPVGCTVRRSIPRLAASTRALGTALTDVLTIIGAATGAGVMTGATTAATGGGVGATGCTTGAATAGATGAGTTGATTTGAVATVAAPIIVNTSVKAVPKARVEAANRGIDLRTVHPTGPDRTITFSDVNSAQIDPAILKRQAANKALIAKGIEMTRGIAQASFNRRANANFDHAQLISAWAKVLRGRPDLAAHEHVGVSLIIESKYGSALPVFRDPDLINIDQLRTLVASTSDAAKNGKVPIAMLSGGTTTIFDLTSYSMSSATPLLFPNQVTSLTIGYDSESTKNISLTIDLNFCDFYDGALLLDALIASL